MARTVLRTEPRTRSLWSTTTDSVGWIAPGRLLDREDMNMRYLSRLAILACVLVPAAALAQHEGHAAGAADQVGSASVDFRHLVLTGQMPDFNRAVALLHSFWFTEAMTAFDDVLAKDPSCAIAYWAPRSASGAILLRACAHQSSSRWDARRFESADAGSPTPRERAYINAAAHLFSDGDSSTQRAGTLAYEGGHGGGNPHLSRRHGSAHLLRALGGSDRARDRQDVRGQLKAAAILEPPFKHIRRIRGWRTTSFTPTTIRRCPKALIAARHYASLAPAVPHALHMPSHTFTRVGSWKESVDTNRRSAETARKSSTAGEELHALDYQTYAYLQIAQDKAAKAVLDHARSPSCRARMASPSARPVRERLALPPSRRVTLSNAARGPRLRRLPLRPANTPYTAAMTHFARRLGAARAARRPRPWPTSSVLRHCATP